MNIVLTERKCKNCKTRLTEYEIEYKQELCIDCYKEAEEKKELNLINR